MLNRNVIPTVLVGATLTLSSVGCTPAGPALGTPLPTAAHHARVDAAAFAPTGCTGASEEWRVLEVSTAGARAAAGEGEPAAGLLEAAGHSCSLVPVFRRWAEDLAACPGPDRGVALALAPDVDVATFLHVQRALAEARVPSPVYVLVRDDGQPGRGAPATDARPAELLSVDGAAFLAVSDVDPEASGPLEHHLARRAVALGTPLRLRLGTGVRWQVAVEAIAVGFSRGPVALLPLVVVAPAPSAATGPAPRGEPVVPPAAGAARLAPGRTVAALPLEVVDEADFSRLLVQELGPR